MLFRYVFTLLLASSGVLPSVELFLSFSNSVIEMESSNILCKLAVCGFSNFFPLSSWIYKSKGHPENLTP